MCPETATHPGQTPVLTTYGQIVHWKVLHLEDTKKHTVVVVVFKISSIIKHTNTL